MFLLASASACQLREGWSRRNLDRTSTASPRLHISVVQELGDRGDTGEGCDNDRTLRRNLTYAIGVFMGHVNRCGYLKCLKETPRRVLWQGARIESPSDGYSSCVGKIGVRRIFWFVVF